MSNIPKHKNAFDRTKSKSSFHFESSDVSKPKPIESKDVRKRKFHCEKEDLLMKQQESMKLKPIGCNDQDEDVASDSDSNSEKDYQLIYECSDIDEEFKSKPNQEQDVNAEDISSEEEDFPSKPSDTINEEIPLENFEEISSDENDDNTNHSKTVSESKLDDEHMESISSDEETLSTVEKNEDNSKKSELSLKNKFVVKVKEGVETTNDKQDLKCKDEIKKEEFHTLESVSSGDEDDLENKDIKNEPTDTTKLIDEKPIKKDRKISKDLDTISSDEENVNSDTKITVKSEPVDLEEKSKEIKPEEIKSENIINDADTISSDEEFLDNTYANKSVESRSKAEEDISSDNFSIHSSASTRVNLKTLDYSNGCYSLDYNFFVSGPEYEDDGTKEITMTEEQLVSDLLKTFEKSCEKQFYKALEDESGTKLKKYKKFVIIGDIWMKKLKYDTLKTKGLILNKDDICVDEIMSLINEHLTDSSSMFLMCSVGMLDILKALLDGKIEIFDLVENILQKIINLRTAFFDKFDQRSAIVFTNYPNINVKSLLDADTIDKYTSVQINNLNAKIYRIIYLLEQNMIVEGLSKFEKYPCWNIFHTMTEKSDLLNNLRQGNSFNVEAINDGFNLKENQANIIIERIISLYKAYNISVDIWRNPIPLSTVHIFSCYNLKVILEHWKDKIISNLVIHYDNTLCLENLLEQVTLTEFKDNCLVVIQLGINDLITTSEEKSCIEHDPLKRISIHNQLNNVKEFSLKVAKIKEKINAIKNVCQVIFMNIDEIDLNKYQVHLINQHAISTFHEVNIKPTFEENCLSSINSINNFIKQLMHSDGIKPWDLSVIDKDGSRLPIFSAFNSPISDSHCIEYCNIVDEFISKTTSALQYIKKWKKDIKATSTNDYKKTALYKSRTPSLSPPPTGYEYPAYGRYSHKGKPDSKYGRSSWHSKAVYYGDSRTEENYRKRKPITAKYGYKPTPEANRGISKERNYPEKSFYPRSRSPSYTKSSFKGDKQATQIHKNPRTEYSRYGKTAVEERARYPRNYGKDRKEEETDRKLYSREREEWDHKEKKKRRVVNYGNVSELEEQEDKYKRKRERSRDRDPPRKRRSSRSRSRSYEDSKNYKGSGSYRDKYARGTDTSTRKNYRYPEGDLMKSSADEVLSLFSNLKIIARDISSVKLSNSWIRIMYDNALELKNSKKDATNIIEKDAITVLKEYRNIFKTEIQNGYLNKSDTGLLKDTMLKIDDLLISAGANVDPYLGLDVKALAINFMGMDTNGILNGIRNSLAANSHHDVKDDTVMQIYIAIKLEQEKANPGYNANKSEGHSYPRNDNPNVNPYHPGDMTQNMYNSTCPPTNMATHQMMVGNTRMPVQPQQAMPNYQSTPGLVTSHLPPPQGPPSNMQPMAQSITTGYLQFPPQSQIPQQSPMQPNYGGAPLHPTADSYGRPPPIPPTVAPFRHPPPNPVPHQTPYMVQQYQTPLYCTVPQSTNPPLTSYPPPDNQNNYYPSTSQNGSTSQSSYSHEESYSQPSNTDIKQMRPDQLIQMFTKYSQLPAYQKSFLMQVLEEFKKKNPSLAETMQKLMQSSES